MELLIVTILGLSTIAMAPTQAVLPKEMIDLMDTTVDPCHDFYQYSCGNWMKAHDLKPWDRKIDSSFTVISERNEQVIQVIVKENKPLVSELWDSCMAIDKITALGNTPLQKDLNRLATANDHVEILQLAGEFSRTETNIITRFDVGADPKNAKTNTIYAYGANLTLPSTSYYSNDYFPNIETEYRTYINNLMKLSGFSLLGNGPDRSAADIVIEIEKALANITHQLDEPRVYPRWSIAYASTTWPLSFGAFSHGVGLLEKAKIRPDFEVLFYATTKYFHLVEELIRSISITDLKIYTAFVLVHSRVRWVGEDFARVSFLFFGQKLNGQQQQPPREKTCVSREIEYFPELIGKYYAMKSFDKEREKSTLTMIQLIREAMTEHLAHLHWLDEETKREAKNKLDKVVHLIGQSTVPRSYPFNLSRDDYPTNIYTILSDLFDAKMRKVSQPVNRMEWSMSPAFVDAYFKYMENKMMFPAAILQPPFYHGQTVHPARNFGAIGALIGHELSHGFDTRGRVYDGDGNQRQWWTMSSTKEYNSHATCLREQYSTFQVNGEHGAIGNVNGNLTIRENIADNGGVSLAWDAYHKYMETVKPSTDGVSSEEGDKMFFIAFGQLWCMKTRDEFAHLQLLINPHSPGQWRTNGVAMNNDHFAKVFKCNFHTPMNPFKKCHLW